PVPAPISDCTATCRPPLRCTMSAIIPTVQTAVSVPPAPPAGCGVVAGAEPHPVTTANTAMQRIDEALVKKFLTANFYLSKNGPLHGPGYFPTFLHPRSPHAPRAGGAVTGGAFALRFFIPG